MNDYGDWDWDWESWLQQGGYSWLQQGLCTIDELRAREDLCRPVLPAPPPRIRLEIVRKDAWA